MESFKQLLVLKKYSKKSQKLIDKQLCNTISIYITAIRIVVVRDLFDLISCVWGFVLLSLLLKYHSYVNVQFIKLKNQDYFSCHYSYDVFVA